MGDLIEATQKRARQVNVLATGFGAFRHTRKNPSWESVKLLSKLGVALADKSKTVSIDVSYIPVEYDYILNTLPYYHANADEKPRLPHDVQHNPEISARDEFQPHKRYDLVLHVGQGRTGGIRIETRGHQLGYRLLDASNALAPVITSGKGATDADAEAPEQLQFMSFAEKDAGMSRGYPLRSKTEVELSEDGELMTDLDVPSLATRLSERFPDVHISKSTNAGRYLCEFILFGSLAESQIAHTRDVQHGAQRDATKVVFVHVPPVNEPLHIEEMARVLQSLVGEIASELPGGRVQD